LLRQQNEKKFRISEIFGPTIQGEGALLGQKTHFIRFGGCDYRCVWCDSMYAVDPTQVAQLPQMDVDEILDRLELLPMAPWVTLSGGNPALFDLDDLVTRLHYRGIKIAIETQGTVFKDWLGAVDLVTCSPKPPSSGNMTAPSTALKFYEKWESKRFYTGKFVFKIVVFDDADWDYAKIMFKDRQDLECWVQVGNPWFRGETMDVTRMLVLIGKLRELSERVLADEEMSHVRVTPQLHVLLWGNARGV
jgi:7-carboxy-7-deazaguanine synthase